MDAVVVGVVATLLAFAAFSAVWYWNQRHVSDATSQDRLHAERLENLDDIQFEVAAEAHLLAELTHANAADFDVQLDQVQQQLSKSVSSLLISVEPGDSFEANEVAAIASAIVDVNQVLSVAWEQGRASTGDPGATAEAPVSSRVATLTGLVNAAIRDERQRMFAAKQTIARDSDRMLAAVLIVAAGWAVVILGLGVAGRYLIARPLQQVSHAARAMAGGSTTHRAPAPFLRELSDMGAAVNTLRDSLTERSEEIQAYLAKDLETKTTELELANARLVRFNSELEAEIQERRKAQEALLASETALLQAQKLESIGRLAGGIAHDFNNLLSAIIGYGELASLNLEPDSQARSDLAECLNAAHRASELTRQLLVFARRQAVEPRVVNLDDLLAGMEKLLRRLIGEDVRLIFDRQAGAAAVKVDPGQLEQVLVNLAVNARDAMPGGGTLTIETDAVTLGGDHPCHHDMAPGEYVVLSVSDTGRGFSEFVREHLFEPFFTTKESGKGTGLGLATCYGVIQQAGGHIVASSTPGHGASFTVYLPRSIEAIAPSAQTELAVAARGAETILLAEDQAEVRELTGRVLREHGYTVLPAATPHEALRLAGAHNGRINLILTDIIMPEMNGVTLVERLGALIGPVPVLFVSGYADQAVLDTGLLRDGTAFLPKPFTRAALLGAVRELLDRGALPDSARSWRAVPPSVAGWEDASAAGA